jgi:hypothetical protein
LPLPVKGDFKHELVKNVQPMVDTSDLELVVDVASKTDSESDSSSDDDDGDEFDYMESPRSEYEYRIVFDDKDLDRFQAEMAEQKIDPLVLHDELE